jgi:hypothetical protein
LRQIKNNAARPSIDRCPSKDCDVLAPVNLSLIYDREQSRLQAGGAWTEVASRQAEQMIYRVIA